MFDDYCKHISALLAKRGLKLTEDGKRYFAVFVLCGEQCKVPDHFVEKIG